MTATIVTLGAGINACQAEVTSKMDGVEDQEQEKEVKTNQRE